MFYSETKHDKALHNNVHMMQGCFTFYIKYKQIRVIFRKQSKGSNKHMVENKLLVRRNNGRFTSSTG